MRISRLIAAALVTLPLTCLARADDPVPPRPDWANLVVRLPSAWLLSQIQTGIQKQCDALHQRDAKVSCVVNMPAVVLAGSPPTYLYRAQVRFVTDGIRLPSVTVDGQFAVEYADDDRARLMVNLVASPAVMDPQSIEVRSLGTGITRDEVVSTAATLFLFLRLGD